MADLQETSSAPNGASAARPSRAQVIAGMADLQHTVEAKPAEAPPAEKPAETSENQSDVGTAEKPIAPKDEADTDGEPKLEAKTEEKPDAETEKRLSAIQKAEKRSREQLTKERSDAKAELQAEIDRARSELSPHMESVKAYKTAKEQARTNPVALLRSLGLGEDDFEYAAQQIYNHSKAAAADPKRRQSAEQAQRDREHEERYNALLKRFDAMESEKKQTAEQARTQQLVDQYLDRVTKAVSDDAPLIKKFLAKNPTKAREALNATAERLYAEHDEVPDPEDVIKAYESARAAELADLDIDIGALKGKPAAAPADPKRPTKTLDTTDSTTTKVSASKKPSREDMLKEMPWGRGD